jgi:hypothetical protein
MRDAGVGDVGVIENALDAETMDAAAFRAAEPAATGGAEVMGRSS